MQQLGAILAPCFIDKHKKAPCVPTKISHEAANPTIREELTMSSIALSFNNVDLVSIDGGEPKTTSLAVAKKFGKRHADVLRAVKNIDCSTEFSLRNFASSDFIDERGKVRQMATMTKDGFTFLVMGFTGKTAAKFKEDFINEFNRMADKLAVDLDNRQLDTLCLDWEQVTDSLAKAGRFLNVAGKQTKPAINRDIKVILARIQPELPNLDDNN